MAYPSGAPYVWTSTTANRDTPSAALQAAGWTFNDVLPEGIANDLWGMLSDYVYYFATEVAPGQGILECEYLRGNGTDDLVVYGNTQDTFVASEADVEIIAGDGTGAQVLTSFQLGTDAMAFGTYDAGSIVSLPATGSFTGYAALFAWTRSGGFAITDLRVTSDVVDAEAGVTAGDNTTTGHRYGYPSGDVLTVSYPLTDSAGAWANQDATRLAIPFVDANGDFGAYNSSGGAGSLTISRSLDFLCDNAEEVSTRFRLVEINMDVNAPIADPMTVTVRRRTRGTASVNNVNTATYNAGAASVTLALGYDMDIGTEAYWIEVTFTNVGAGADASASIRDALIEIDKSAVE